MNVSGAIDDVENPPAGVVAAAPAESSPELISPAALPARKPGVPSWFKTAREKARRTEEESAPQVQRSRYADALDAALRSESEPAEGDKDDAASRLQKMRERGRRCGSPISMRCRRLISGRTREPAKRNRRRRSRRIDAGNHSHGSRCNCGRRCRYRRKSR